MTKKQFFIFFVSWFLAVAIFLSTSAYFIFLHHYSGVNKQYVWSVSDEFDINSVATVQKKKGKDFVILNLADTQMCDLEDIFNLRTMYDEISFLINKTNPDLITLSGDQTWSNENFLSLKALVKWLDSFKIPYAPVFGNHDYGNDFDSAVLGVNACCDVYESGKYSLFKRGPSNLGTLGNYVVNIVEDGKIFRTLYMIDSGYNDILTDEQISFFEWNAQGIMEQNGGEYTEGMVFLHKPLPEYGTAYYKYLRDEVESVGDVFVSYSLSGSIQNGFFEVARQKNVKNIVCSHQHGNSFTLSYQGVNLTFALKTGELGGFYHNKDVYLNGASYFVLGENTKIERLFVERDKYAMK